MSQTPPPDSPKRTETLIETPVAAPAPFRPPANLAALTGYRIQRLLGQGGMGEVYLAHNERMDRPEVLKAVHKELLNKSGALERFQNEIRSAGRLQHPNIVTAYSCHEAGDSLVMAMEYVPGQDLAAVVKAGGALPVANACHYVRQAALGLQHAFEKGMVHRDIKPHNLMLHRDGSRHTVKILDFGLAKVTSEKPVDGGLTRDGQMLGTPDYVAPEQTRDAAKADIRSDIYSLGCTLHYLLAARPPFTGNSLFEILEAHNFKPAPRLDGLRPEVPPALADVVAKMMAKDPAQRYQTPAQVAVALQPFTRPATKVLMSKPAGPPPVPTPATAGSGSTAPGLSGKTPAPMPGKSTTGPMPAPPPVPKSGNSEWYFEDSGSRPPRPAASPAAPKRRRSRLPILLGLLFVFILVGGGLGGLYLAGVLRPKTSPTAPAPELAKAPTPPDLEPELKTGPKDNPKTEPPVGPKVSDPKVSPGPKTKLPDPVPPVEKKAAPKVEAKTPPKVEPPKTEPALAWTPLYNGRDTTGWEASELLGSAWKVENKELVGNGTDHVTRPALLLTRAAYPNFVLKFEAFAPDDVERRLLLRARATTDRLRGYALLLSGNRSGAGALAVYDNDPARCVPNWQRPAADVRPPTGKWNAWEVACVGSRIHVKLDGREVADWDLAGNPHSSGGLGFTTAGPAGLRFRKIEVADLPAKHQDACKLAGITERGRETGSTSTPIPYGDAFWRKWQTFGATDWDLTPDGKLTLKGAGGLITRGNAADLSVTLAPGPETECWVSLKLTSTGASYSGPGVQVVSTTTRATAGQGALRANEQLAGTGRNFKPGESFSIDVAVSKFLVIMEELGGRRVPHLVGTVYTDSSAKPKEPNCKVPLDDDKQARVGLILKKGTVTIHAIDGP